jgi:hypothetical protein
VFLNLIVVTGLKKKDFLLEVEQKAIAADQRTANNEPLVGREFFRNPEVNLGFYSKKRTGVADVDPKVRHNIPINGYI